LRIPEVAAVLSLLAFIGGGIRQAGVWRTASEIARSSVLSLRDAPADKPLIMLSLPDHYRGAYIWRVSLREGVAVLLPERANQPIYALSRFTMRLQADVRVQYANGVTTLSSSNDIFLPPEDLRPPLGDEPMVLPDKVVIPMSVLRHGAVLAYHEGRFRPVEP
jgi:hypothetical protein